jgi:sulfate transport system ATP-binding protein
MSIQVKGINKQFGAFTALNNINLDINSGELLALLGPSGCGKTTLLRVIAGLEVPDQGQILFDGENTTDTHVRERQVGFVFQHYALFRHMTVFENVAFGLRVRPKATRPSESEIRRKVHELLNLVQLDWLADRYPPQLSGGQRQRIALARALAVEPKVLLLDEPFGALDTKVRKELRRWLRRLHDEMHITSVFVTHDQEEALEVADRIVVMNKGKIEQTGTPDEVYDKPATQFVYQFLGNVNLFHSRIHGGFAQIGELQLPASEHGNLDAPGVAYVRPHDIEIDRSAIGNALPVKIDHIRAIGPVVRLEMTLQDTQEIVEAELTREVYQSREFKVGERVFIRPRQAKVFVSEDYAI